MSGGTQTGWPDCKSGYPKPRNPYYVGLRDASWNSELVNTSYVLMHLEYVPSVTSQTTGAEPTWKD